ncbi:hypothetical protein EK0264_13995 [Epidermidibacterium keratini]|uniref:Uncharacterized protein n=1 Tax=Epidermidibacterium keratini TaxID=1891644 RepID=A0A7L4YQ42_9ACTN|nr:SurA N-terminal domain-containing protein [Epidermidibacterium keratini]QHC01286.1 hypothetical protein EK0264_13995 [Epidermidibacterium keratini]
MTSRLGSRVVGAVLGVLVLALGLSACSSSPSVVMTVAGEELTAKEYQAKLDEAFADPIVGDLVKEQGEPYKISYLNQLMQYEVINQIAKQEGITYTDADIDEYADQAFNGNSFEQIQQQSAAQGQYYTKEHLRMLLTQQYVQSKLGEKTSGQTLEETTAQAKTQIEQQVATTPGLLDSWDLLFVAVNDPAQGQAWADAINSGARTIEDIGAEAGPGPDGTPQPATTSVTGQDAQGGGFLEQIGPLQTGQAGMLSLPDQSTGTTFYVLIYVVERTPGDVDAEAAKQADSTFAQAGSSAVADASKDIKIDVNPRYGKLERPEQGLPSIGDSQPDTFTTPAPESGAGGVPGMPPGSVPGQ